MNTLKHDATIDTRQQKNGQFKGGCECFAAVTVWHDEGIAILDLRMMQVLTSRSRFEITSPRSLAE